MRMKMTKRAMSRMMASARKASNKARRAGVRRAKTMRVASVPRNVLKRRPSARRGR